jgi:hypothetical protein
MLSCTTGGGNTAVGFQAAYSGTTALDNTAVGLNALIANTSGSYNTAIGRQALNANTTASNNVAVGYQAGYSVTTGGVNTFVGRYAGYYVTTGINNTILGGYNGNQGGLDIRTASNYIVLSDGDGNPRGIFDSSGNFLVGATTNSRAARLRVEGGETAYFTGYGNGYGIGLWMTPNASASGGTADPIKFQNVNNTTVGSISTTASATSYNTSSDYRLKENIAPMTGALATVSALKPVTYDWIADKSKGQGFIAHELQAVVPDCVTGEKDAVDADGNPVYQGIDASFLVATLTAAIQELKAEFDAYKATHP